MRRKLYPFVVFLISQFLILNVQAQSISEKADTVEVIPQFKNFYHYQNFYITGQPTLEALKWLKSRGVSKIINLRTEKEMAEYAESAYNEKAVVQEMGFKYILLPVEGIKGYTPENLKKFNRLLSKNEKILIHCHSARRAMDFFAGYLIEDRGYSVNTIKEIDKRGILLLPLERLLGKEIELKIKK